MQLRSHRWTGGRSTQVATAGHVGAQGVSTDAGASTSGDETLAQLVASAAAAAPTVHAVCIPGVSLSFGDLAERARGAAMAMSGDKRIDDSALTVALMMTIPGLAASGASGLSSTLSSVRIQATMAVVGSRQA